MIKFMADDGQQITCAQDAALYDLIGHTDYIIDDVGEQMRVDYNASSLNATVNSGEAVICGRHVSIEGTESVVLPASSAFFLVIRYDLRETGTNVVKILTTDSKYEGYLNDPAHPQQCEDMILAYITTGASGVSTFDDRRVLFSEIAPSSGNILYGTSEPTNDMGKDGDIYIQYAE